MQTLTITPLTKSHLTLAHEVWKAHIKEAFHVIDATCGRGKDSLKLAQSIGPNGSLIGLDLQAEAIDQTRSLLEVNLTPDVFSRVHLFHQSHETFPAIAYERAIFLVVYNLGYLPQGDKHITTMTRSTINSISNATSLLQPGGMISITCYPGHAEGKLEEAAIMTLAAQLSKAFWEVQFFKNITNENAPSLLFLHKKLI